MVRSEILKIKTFDRDNFTCLKCGHVGKRGIYSFYGGMHIDLIADHIIPLKMNGKDELENMQTLCINCNKIKNAKDQSDIAKRKRDENNR